MSLVLLIGYLLSQSSGVHLCKACLFFVIEFVYGVVIFTKEMTMVDNYEAFHFYYRIVFVRLLIHLLRSLLLLFLFISCCHLTVFRWLMYCHFIGFLVLVIMLYLLSY